ncbi:hypothetical protein CLV35_2964 [Motilibacter peucedani]|uniref:Uncharacterized protein n=1 Tax=Motilibacter peucedani TaxID=598650 RepID=A0A420XN73_9ACTN|nr:MSMEG_6728 family protein [Motilibacter peucedani]RKS72715.1 hypothetical protein CLV35_2964 [Motilibacter peucedani]
MQTFVPYPGFVDSARILDDRRLGKQRVETFQILRALTWPTYAWKNHPATRMWRGFVPALVCYGLACIDAWERRGRLDATRSSLLEFTGGVVPEWSQLRATGQLPPWLGHSPVHISHQSALVRKDPEFYRPFFPDVPDDLPYLWPSPSFPRWPVRRPALEALPEEEALAMLGFTEMRPWQRAAVDAALAGSDAVVPVPPGQGATSAGLLAAMVTLGRTLWVAPGPALPEHPGEHEEQRPAAPASKLSTSVARAPSAADLAAMEDEGRADPEFRFVRPGDLASAWTADTGLVVVEGEDVDPGPLPRRVPLLRLVPDVEATPARR